MSTELRLPTLISAMAKNAELWGMGHGQKLETQDLGLGWTYYGITRTLKPRLAVVIGSWRGFVPLLIGQAIQENNNAGRVLFIDPSFVDNHWKDGGATQHFASFGVTCIEHLQQTSQEVISDPNFSQLKVDLLFIDGLHTEEQCRMEFEAFSQTLTPGAITLFHDSRSRIVSDIYGKEKIYTHTTWRYIEELRSRSDLQVFDLAIDQGITLVQHTPTPPDSH